METSDYLRICIGNRIRERRKELKYSVDDLAERCDVSSEHIRKIESGYRAPGIELFVDICNSLKTSSEYFLQDLIKDVDKNTTIYWHVDGVTSGQRDLMDRLREVGEALLKAQPK